jgi:uncharacterized OsmC-like protein
MNEERLVTHVRSQSIGIHGRCVNTARHHHFIIDEPAYGGGPGEALTPAEAFLAGVSGCAVLLVESFARASNYPLTRASASIEGIRLKTDPANFRQVVLKLELGGVDSKQAADLVDRFKGR